MPSRSPGCHWPRAAGRTYRLRDRPEPGTGCAAHRCLPSPQVDQAVGSSWL